MGKPGGRERLTKKSKDARAEYITKRERAKQAYLQYAMMPIEQDAWLTGGLVQQALGLEASKAEEELKNLDADERSMIPVLVLALSTGSHAEQHLVKKLQSV